MPSFFNDPRFRHRRRLIAVLGVAIVVLGVYMALPVGWRHYEHLKGMEGRPMVTRTKQGIPGDPINFGLVGTQNDLFCVFDAAGWRAANPVTFKSSLKIVRSVALRRPYPTAPVSPLYYDGRAEDLAFELESGRSAQIRHHVRFWQVQPGVWLASASFDKGVGVSHYTLRVTHHIDPDLDAERDFLSGALARTGLTQTRYEISGIGPTLSGRNGGGDPYFTDGEVDIETLHANCKGAPGQTPQVLDNPWQVALKNALWRAARKTKAMLGLG